MKICFIYPPSSDAVKAMMIQSEDSESGGIGFKPPLGMLYIASFLKASQPHHDLLLIDSQAEQLDIMQIISKVSDFRPDILGITAWTDFWYSTYKLIGEVKKALPNTHICVGGPHVGIFPDVILNYSEADSIILGDGEVPFSMLVQAIENSRSITHIPGVYTKASLKASLSYYIHKDLDSLPNPDRTLLNYKLYYSILGKKTFVSTMITSRGCPYRCIFCKLNFQKTLCRSAKSVISEFEQMAGLGIEEVEIYDDTFTWSKQRVIDICKGIIDRRFNIAWAIRDRVNNVDDELLDWMWKAGCHRIHYGVESGLDKTLETIQKNITTEQAIQAVKKAKIRGFEVLTYFMLGLPGETEKDMLATVKFAMELNPDYTTFNVAIPYAGTEMYEMALKKGIIPFDYWAEFTRKPTPGFVIPYYYEEFVDKNCLLNMRNYAIRRFYFRYSFLLKQITKINSFQDFYRKAKLGWVLFKNSFLGRYN